MLEEKQSLIHFIISLPAVKTHNTFLYGRRHVGKTALIREALKNINDAAVIYHEFHRVSPEQNLAEFSKSIEEALSIPSLPSFPSLQYLSTARTSRYNPASR